MAEISVIFLYFYSIISFFGVNVGIHTDIMKYWFTTEECGIGRESKIMEKSCFEWQNSKEQIDMIRDGRPARIGEFPWIFQLWAFVEDHSFSCTTSLFNSYWIITAAHCFGGNDIPNGSFVYPVGETLMNKTLGEIYKIPVQYVFNHPGWDGNYYDLAVARLKRPIDLIEDHNKPFREMNTICFPRKYSVNKNYEHALLMGTGAISTNQNQYSLWTGWTRMYPIGRGGKGFQYDTSGEIIRVQQIARNYSSATCSGDSGSPLVQYINGRAVVVGINSGSRGGPKDKECTTEKSESIFARVSQFIDWIGDKVALGERWAYTDHIQRLNKTKSKIIKH